MIDLNAILSRRPPETLCEFWNNGPGVGADPDIDPVTGTIYLLPLVLTCPLSVGAAYMNVRSVAASMNVSFCAGLYRMRLPLSEPTFSSTSGTINEMSNVSCSLVCSVSNSFVLDTTFRRILFKFDRNYEIRPQRGIVYALGIVSSYDFRPAPVITSNLYDLFCPMIRVGPAVDVLLPKVIELSGRKQNVDPPFLGLCSHGALNLLT